MLSEAHDYSADEVRRLAINVRAIQQARRGATGEMLAEVTLNNARALAYREFRDLPETQANKLNRSEMHILRLEQAYRALALKVEAIVEPTDTHCASPEQRSTDHAELPA